MTGHCYQVQTIIGHISGKVPVSHFGKIKACTFVNSHYTLRLGTRKNTFLQAYFFET